MTTTTTVIADTPDYTLTQIVDDVAQCTTLQTTYKTGSAGFNIQAMLTKMATALSAMESADANWATLTTAQKIDASRDAIQCAAKLVRFMLGRFDAN